MPPNPRIVLEAISRAKAVQVAGQVVLERVKQVGRVISAGYGIGNVVVYNPDGTINIQKTAENAVTTGRGRDQVSNTGVPFGGVDHSAPVTIDDGSGVTVDMLPMWQHDP